MSVTGKKVRFNIIDVIIVILLLAAIAGTIFRDSINGFMKNEKTEEISYTFEIKQADSDMISGLTQGVIFFESESKKEMGRVISVQSKQSYVTEYALDGSIMTLEKAGYNDLIVNAVANGFKSDTGIFTDGNILIVPGKSYQINTKTAVFYMTILSVN
ncbi:MAG TPA: hypothetical protein DD733_06400 [Clostridiales bacterium]|nr:DUF4330 family protein [Eubacteriales bacterium]HBR31697.1 hypothetical protein [Clostridiales bacterium]